MKNDTLNRQAAEILLQMVKKRDPKVTIPAVIDEFAQKYGLRLPANVKELLVREICRGLN